ncbi:alpha/beta hydrolase-fold protein [Nocardioides sp. GY 10127]|uniref:alpha/beta hydrolase-fold protein n=1 Tax=Nocardioides sp. GY 10127 TaxID=2569762 RepID=UPI0010A83BDC|nr:alpha/beta hydrolase-fold protein [Nocardioides sp. GY 10127]TIC82687.1 hypothetical protein E8D37_08265 [Nocardioides sp. GY 10127]
MPLSRREAARSVALAVGATAALGALEAPSTAASAAAKKPTPKAGKYGPLVRHTGRGPTGYQVTFRYHAPSATRVQLKGEWYFQDPLKLSPRLYSPDHAVESDGLVPEDWYAGCIPMSHPNSTNPWWPVVDMVKGRDGTWTTTVPLPGGVYTYGFFVDGDADYASTTGQLPDPANPAWNVHKGVVDGRAVDRSQVYVPSDPDFDPVDMAWQGPTTGTPGALRYVTYDSPDHLDPVGQNFFVVYTPPGYDRKRSEPYPTFYLSHGGGEDEMGWTTQGNMQNILDNLINEGLIEPMLVVMPNGNGYAASDTNEDYRVDLRERVIPWMEAHYHVSPDPLRRAFSGLSAGGMRTAYLLVGDTDLFGYYGIMSAGLPPGTVITDEMVAELVDKQVYVGSGWSDPIDPGFTLPTTGRAIHRGPFRAVRDLTDAGVHVTSCFIDGTHEWHVWRLMLRDFLTRCAFLPQTSAPESWGA